MKVLRRASYDEYIAWYLGRELRKRGQPFERLLQSTPLSLRSEMEQFHSGKLRPWFKDAHWSITEFQAHELLSVVCVDEERMRRTKLVTNDVLVNNRLLCRVLENARKYRYFEDHSVDAVERFRRRAKIDRFRQCWPVFCGEDQVALCSLNHEEKQQNPSGTYYLNDGFGRLLAYLYLGANDKRECAPVEAIVAESSPAGSIT